MTSRSRLSEILDLSLDVEVALVYILIERSNTAQIHVNCMQALIDQASWPPAARDDSCRWAWRRVYWRAFGVMRTLSSYTVVVGNGGDGSGVWAGSTRDGGGDAV